MAETTMPEETIRIPDVPPAIMRAVQVAAATQFCTFTSGLTEVNGEYSIEAVISPDRRPVGAQSPARYRVRFLIPKAFPYATVETIPLDPELKWHPHQRGDWPLDIDPHANVLCPPRMAGVHFDELLLPYIRHAYRWITAALNDDLTRPDERYEMPHIETEKGSHPQFMIEGGPALFPLVGEYRSGAATLKKIQGFNKFDVFRVEALYPQGQQRIRPAWHSGIKENAFGPEDDQPMRCPWFYAGNPAIAEPHRPPVCWDDFPQRMQRGMLRAIAEAAQTWTPQPYLLMAFSIPETWGGEPDRIVWQCLELAGLEPQCFKQPNGFRQQKITLWPKVRRFIQDNATLHWLACQDVSTNSRRSRAASPVRLRKVATSVLGVGALGSMLVRSLSKAELGPLIIIDPQVVVPGNLVRHEALATDVFRPKAEVVRSHCQAIGKDCNIISRVGDVVQNWNLFADELTKTDLIIDATGDHGVHAFVAKRPELDRKMVAWCFMTPGPDFATLILRCSGSALDVQSAEHTMFAELDPQTRDTFETVTNDGLVWPEPGCYHPTFRAPYHRVRMMADAILTTLLDWLHEGPKRDVITLFRQQSPEGKLGYETHIIRQISPEL